jgi:PadR family transcriptional regulator AphA
VLFASQLGAESARRLLERRRVEATEYLATLQQQLEAHGPAAAGQPGYFQLATLRNGIRHVQAELEWLREGQEELA